MKPGDKYWKYYRIQEHYQIEPTGPFIYVAVGGLCVSACAPSTMTKKQVEDWVYQEVGPTLHNTRWMSIDKSRLGRGYGESTPNKCEVWAQRIHWFLVAVDFAEEHNVHVETAH